VLGPSSLAFAEGTPWFGGAQSKLLAVAEGVEGSTAAPLASAVAVRALSRYVASLMPWVIDLQAEDERELEQELTRALVRGQKRLRAEARSHGYDAARVAATMTIAYIAWPQLFLVHVGDSRGFLYRDGSLHGLTGEGTVGAELAKRGVIAAETAHRPPYERAVASTLGGRNDALELELRRYRLSAGDQVLLCTSDMTRQLGELEIAREIDAGVTAQMTCRRLVDAAKQKHSEGRFTAVLARVEEQAASRPLAASRARPGTPRSDEARDSQNAGTQKREAVVLHAKPKRTLRPGEISVRDVVEAAEPRWSVLGEQADRRDSEP